MTPTTTPTPNNEGTPNAVSAHSVPPQVDISNVKDRLETIDEHEKKYPHMSDVDLLAEASACHKLIIANRAVIAKALAETVVLMHRAGRATCILSSRHRETNYLWNFILTLLKPATFEELNRCHEIQEKYFWVFGIAHLNLNQLFRAAMIFPKKKTEEQ